MRASYLLRQRPSYALRVWSLAIATVACVALSCCSDERPVRPANVVVAKRVPATWPKPYAIARPGDPQIAAMRFSTLDVALGSEWDGDAVASLDTTRIDVRTNLFDFTMPQTSPGRFHFSVHVLDLPAFLVRPYALHVVAYARDGRTTTMLVPFRIHGRV